MLESRHETALEQCPECTADTETKHGIETCPECGWVRPQGAD